MASYAAAGTWNGSQVSYDGSEELRTVFISGFPSDIKERELQNLLRWWPGYEACQINYKGDQPLGFALFGTAATAIAAKDALHDLVFDPETNSILRTEMAKKNLFVKKSTLSADSLTRAPPPPGTASTGQPPYSSPSYPQDVNVSYKRPRTTTGGAGEYASYSTGGENPAPAAYYAQPPPGAPGQQPQYAAPQAPYYAADQYAPSSYAIPQTGGHVATAYAAPPPAAAISPSSAYPTTPTFSQTRNTRDNPPCNTLFIGNLGDNTSEEELKGVLAVQPGFCQLKLLRQAQGIVCFVEYADTPSAVAVHSSLQGLVLTSSDRGGIRIQYSKNPFGRRRDGSSHADYRSPRDRPSASSRYAPSDGYKYAEQQQQQQHQEGGAAGAAEAVGGGIDTNPVGSGEASQGEQQQQEAVATEASGVPTSS